MFGNVAGGKDRSRRYVVSACLAGVNCRYHGGNNLHPLVERLVREGRAVPVCPEQLGGLSTPRPPMEIQGGDGAAVMQGKARVVTGAGDDVTAQVVRGAEEAVRLARLSGATHAILKARSPSCGCGVIYDGTFSGRRVAGDGVAAAHLKATGLTVCSEEDLADG